MTTAYDTAWLYSDEIIIGIPMSDILAWCLIYPASRALRGS